MRILGDLEPHSVFTYFEDLCAIPHGSGNTKAISDYCVRYAEAHGFEVHQDALNNIIMICPATPGCEDAEPVILQGHLDMVAEKTVDCPLDMAKDGLALAVDGDHVCAKGTTLGGDDGIAVAMALAAMDDKTLRHPRIEAIFTVDEEVGMEGAAGLDVSPITARRMINIDSEDEGIFTVSCAGGARANLRLPLETAPCSLPTLVLELTGLTGGHSGTEIDKGRANAAILLGRVLDALSEAAPLRIVSAESGLKDNAIPAAARAVFAFEGDADAAQQTVSDMQAAFRAEHAGSDPALALAVRPGNPAPEALTEAATQKVIRFLQLVPNGIAAMSADIPGLVQTSCNLGVFQVSGGLLTASSAVRSSVASQKTMLLRRFAALAALLGAQMHITGDYPAWEYKRDSVLRDVMMRVFTAQYGHAPKIEAIHAGLECGLFAGKLPGLDCVSLGPDLLEIHTPRERMSVSSVQRTWQLLRAVLSALCG
mgnify:CR=1 FL=1